MTVMTANQVDELLNAAQWDEAEKVLKRMSRDELPESGRSYYLGRIAEARCEWAEAMDHYQRVVDEHADHKEATFRLALLVDRFGFEQKAIELYERCTHQAPAPVNALLNLSVLYEDDERYEDALTCLDRILDEHPNDSRARLFYKDVASSMSMYYDEEGERYREKRDALLDTPISEFELSVRSRNCLRQMNIHTLGDLLRVTPVELLAYKNFGETSLHEIEAMLSQKGLRIGQLLEDRDGGLMGTIMPESADTVKSSLMSRSVSELELSVRSRKCLMRLGVASIGELCQRSEPELLTIKNFGMTSLSEIKVRLTELGLALRAD